MALAFILCSGSLSDRAKTFIEIITCDSDKTAELYSIDDSLITLVNAIIDQALVYSYMYKSHIPPTDPLYENIIRGNSQQ